MNESITKAAQSAALVVADLKAALMAVVTRGNSRPEGGSMTDRAAAAYIAGCMDDALKLQSRLEMISVDLAD